MAQNNCPVIQTEHAGVFSLKGIPLQTTAPKILVNMNRFFERYVLQPTLLEGSAPFITSKVSSIHDKTIRGVLANWRKGMAMSTPGQHHRAQPFRVQCKIDSFRADQIKRIIMTMYAQNIPPLAADIYKTFMDQVKAEEEHQRTTSGEDVIPFKCSEKTFRLILHRLGFKFGRINTRDVLLMRLDIVNWRGKNISEMRKNRQSEQPMKVIWLDETWIDPNGRTGKAWVPKNPKNYRERSQYSYQKHKVSRDPRIIVLNAGGEDGYIEGAMQVYKVSKRDVTGDYHDNVNADVFIKWFENLLDILDRTGHKYIIVTDNAPYHGRAEVPKCTARKAELYNWLKANLGDKETLKPEKAYKRPELWSMVKAKKKSSEFYVIDRMAAARGHRVLRLPPYNCDLSPIEFCWKDLKHEVRKLNVRQTLDDVIQLAKTVMSTYHKAKWQKHIAHVIRLEDEYWRADGFYDEFCETNRERLIISINDDDDDFVSYGNADYETVPISPSVVTSVVHDELPGYTIGDEHDPGSIFDD